MSLESHINRPIVFADYTTRRFLSSVVVWRAGSRLYTAHAGDSRAVLCRQGRPLRLTQDHKPNLPAERARIERVGGRVHFQSNCWWGPAPFSEAFGCTVL